MLTSKLFTKPARNCILMLRDTSWFACTMSATSASSTMLRAQLMWYAVVQPVALAVVSPGGGAAPVAVAPNPAQMLVFDVRS